MHTYLYIGIGFALIALCAGFLIWLSPRFISSEMKKLKDKNKNRNQKLYELKKQKKSKQEEKKKSSTY